MIIDTIVRTLKGIMPDETWDYIFNQFKPHSVDFKKPPYSAVRVSKDYMLVKVPKETKK